MSPADGQKPASPANSGEFNPALLDDGVGPVDDSGLENSDDRYEPVLRKIRDWTSTKPEYTGLMVSVFSQYFFASRSLYSVVASDVSCLLSKSV